METLVSVIVPIYNVETYLSTCLDSVVAQTYTNLEILLVDDGSTDKSGAICDEYAKLDSRIKVIHQENKGVSAARNVALETCAGEYIMFVDADDYISEDAVAFLYHRLLEDGSDLAIGQLAELNNERYHVNPRYDWMFDSRLSSGDALALLGTSRDLYGYPVGKLYRSKILDNLQFPTLTCGEDAWIFPHVLARCSRISISSKIVYYYVQRASSATHIMSEQHILDVVKSRLHIADFLLENGFEKNGKIYFNMAVHSAVGVKNKKLARTAIEEMFSCKEQFLLLNKDINTLIRWTILYVPVLYIPARSAYRMMKKLKNGMGNND